MTWGSRRSAAQGTNLAEDKKTAGAPAQDQTSRIARAIRSMPQEQREKPFLEEQADIQNPELDKAFDKMVELYKARRPDRENAVVSFPARPTLRVSKPASEPGSAFECPECGHNNPAGTQFCGMCGAPREDAVAVAPSDNAEREESIAGGARAESGAKQHHHYYHHHHYRNNPYLLLAVALLLAVIAWQQWRAYKQSAAKPAPAPALQVQPPAPASSQPAPTQKPASPAPAPAPQSSTKPVSKPPVHPSSVRPSVEPVRQGEPPGPLVRAVERETPAAPAPAQALPSQRVPALPTFAATPATPATQRLRVSQGISAGRLIRKVSPVFPPYAKRAGIEGTVVLEAIVAKDGSVQELEVVSGNPALAQAAVDAVRQWKYQPYVLNGQPVEVDTRIQVNFKR